MVYGVETVVVGQCDVRVVFEQQAEDVLSALADRIVQWRITFGVLVVQTDKKVKFKMMVSLCAPVVLE